MAVNTSIPFELNSSCVQQCSAWALFQGTASNVQVSTNVAVSTSSRFYALAFTSSWISVEVEIYDSQEVIDQRIFKLNLQIDWHWKRSLQSQSHLNTLWMPGEFDISRFKPASLGPSTRTAPAGWDSERAFLFTVGECNWSNISYNLLPHWHWFSNAVVIL